MNAVEFSRKLRESFPELTDELNDPVWAGLLHLETAVLARFAESAITRCDYAALDRCYEFAAEAVALKDESVENAICVSFLEYILLDARTAEEREAERRLPDVLRALLTDLREHWKRLVNARRS